MSGQLRASFVDILEASRFRPATRDMRPSLWGLIPAVANNTYGRHINTNGRREKVKRPIFPSLAHATCRQGVRLVSVYPQGSVLFRPDNMVRALMSNAMLANVIKALEC